MTVNNTNLTDPQQFVPLNTPDPNPNAKTADVSKEMKVLTPDEASKFKLERPIAEIVRTRKEFVQDERTGKGCGICYTYMERTMFFAGANGGSLTLMSGGSRDAYFAVNMDTSPRDLAKSRTDMNSMRSAAEETLEIRLREKSEMTAGAAMAGTVTENGSTSGSFMGAALSRSLYKYNRVSVTKGGITFKDGGRGAYEELAVSSRELYNQCAAFIAASFGDDSSVLTLSADKFREIFAEKAEGADNKLQAGSNIPSAADKELSGLKRYMERKLAEVRDKDPENGSLKAFSRAFEEMSGKSFAELTELSKKLTTLRFGGGGICTRV